MGPAFMPLSWKSGCAGTRATGPAPGEWTRSTSRSEGSGQWKYLFRAVDKEGRLIDFMLLDRRNTSAAHRFLGKALRTMRNWPPHSITTDKLGSYPKAIRRLQRKGTLSEHTKHRTSEYLNNIIEADHGGLKRVIKPTRGFQTMNTAAATIKGFEIMRMIKRRYCLLCKPNVSGEIKFINKLLRLPPDLLSIRASYDPLR